MGRITVRRRITRLTVGEPPRQRDDLLAVEEPLEIRVSGRALAITMRTPGHDVELAAGFLLSEGVIARGDDIVAARHCASGESENSYNVLDIALAAGVSAPAAGLERNFYTTSSCGMCGKASIDAVRTSTTHPIHADALRVSAAVLSSLPDRLRAAQDAFEKTGGLHAAGLFDATTGRMLVVREDVGRHNAVDKVIGWAVREGMLPLSGIVLIVSGRVSFELTQKAWMAGIPMLAAVSAPSSLAIELAEEAGMTVVGFLRGASMVVYSSPERIVAIDDAEIEVA